MKKVLTELFIIGRSVNNYFTSVKYCMKNILIIGCSWSAGEYQLVNYDEDRDTFVKTADKYQKYEDTFNYKGWYYYTECLQKYNVTVASFPGRGYLDYASYVKKLVLENKLDYDAILIQETEETRLNFDAVFDQWIDTKFPCRNKWQTKNLCVTEYGNNTQQFMLRNFSDLVDTLERFKIKVVFNSKSKIHQLHHILEKSYSMTELALNAKTVIEIECQKRNIPIYTLSFGPRLGDTLLNYSEYLGLDFIWGRYVTIQDLELVSKAKMKKYEKKFGKNFYYFHQSPEGNKEIGKYINSLLKNYI